MKKVTLLFICVVSTVNLFFLFGKAAAHHTDIDSTMYQYVKMVQEERYDHASSLLLHHKEELEQVVINYIPDAKKQTLTDLIKRNNDIMKNENTNKVDKRIAAYSLMLAVDTVKNTDKPEWWNWKTKLENKLSSLIRQSVPVSQQQIDEVTADWRVIAPALELSMGKEDYLLVASAYNQLEHHTVNKDYLEAALEKTRLIELADIESLKGNTPLLYLLASVGGCIVATLGYVAWKKYQGEKNKKLRDTNS